MAKKASAKKAKSAKGTSTKKTSAKKASTKGTSTKGTSTKKTSAKKASTKTKSTKKTSAKKTSAKKASTKKTSTKKVSAKKVSAKKVSAKKASAKKVSAKKVSAKKASANKTSVEMTSARSSGGVSGMRRLRQRLLAHALHYPGAWEDRPWGESVAKVGKKVFVFLGQSTDEALARGVGMSVKLPESGDLALALPFAEPTGYGLGRSGWVSFRLRAGEMPPFTVLMEWIEQSYRAVAPKRRIAELDALRG